MELLTILAAAEAAAEGSDQTPFYLVGGLLAVFAVLAGLYGITRERMESRAATGVAVLGGALVVAAMASSVFTA